ncbi:MAG: GNAT family N-acetyltransferase [Thermodesulfobacteriota bacterium]
MIHYETTITNIDWGKAAEVFRLAPLGERDPEMLSRAFQRSYAYVFTYDDEMLIGLCRALSDGEYQAAIYDVVLLPEYHGRGIGKEMVRLLFNKLQVPNIILFSAPGREGFYRKFGFKKMLTAMGILQPRIGAPECGYLEP